MLCGTQCVQCDMLAVFGIWIDSIYYVVWSIRYLDHVGIQNHDNNLLFAGKNVKPRVWQGNSGYRVEDINGECNKEPEGGACYSWIRALHTKEYIKGS